MGLYRESSLCYKLYIRAVFKADIRRIRPLQDGNSEHFLSGAGLRRVGACALAEMYMSYTGKIGRRVHKWYMLQRRR